MTKSINDQIDARAPSDIAHDPQYGHFVRIPDRIITCLAHFNIESDCDELRRRLLAYYLFIGVIDEAIDSGELSIGAAALAHFRGDVMPFLQSTSRVAMAVDDLKEHVSADDYSAVLTTLEKLYRSVIDERRAQTIVAYIRHRKLVGALTAELSYIIIRSLLKNDRDDLSRFLQRVGAVGCLVDSVIDFRADAHLGLISFDATVRNFLVLLATTVREGF